MSAIRFIVPREQNDALVCRVVRVCAENQIEILSRESVPYWKIEGLKETTVPCSFPVLEFEQLCELFLELFSRIDDSMKEPDSVTLIRYSGPQDAYALFAELYLDRSGGNCNGADQTGEERTAEKWKAEQNKKYLLNKTKVRQLFRFLQKELDKEPCDHTLKKTAQWVGAHCPPDKLEPILQEMRDMGGYCDCEVLLNCYERYEIE